jgi:hypothetical protein
MKKLSFIFALSVLIVSCGNDPKKTTTDEEQSNEQGVTTTVTRGEVGDTFSGMFLYLESENAAVLQTAGSKMYGVVIDEKMHELNEQCKKFKNKDHDMVPVVIRGEKKPNPIENAWKEVVVVKEILSVQKPSENDGTIIIKNNQ